jgi:Zn finger protein HypA/HybF involved in hydrogenase expression
MHELAITPSVVEAVTERTGSAPVASVRLRVAGMVPDAVRFCFDPQCSQHPESPDLPTGDQAG